jgi:hypothetical protein
MIFISGATSVSSPGRSLSGKVAKRDLEVEAGQPVTAPGVPLDYRDPADHRRLHPAAAVVMQWRVETVRA